MIVSPLMTDSVNLLDLGSHFEGLVSLMQSVLVIMNFPQGHYSCNMEECVLVELMQASFLFLVKTLAPHFDLKNPGELFCSKPE